MELTAVNYRITEIAGWVIVTPSGKAANNEPLRLRYVFRRDIFYQNSHENSDAMAGTVL